MAVCGNITTEGLYMKEFWTSLSGWMGNGFSI